MKDILKVLCNVFAVLKICAKLFQSEYLGFYSSEKFLIHIFDN